MTFKWCFPYSQSNVFYQPGELTERVEPWNHGFRVQEVLLRKKDPPCLKRYTDNLVLCHPISKDKAKERREKQGRPFVLLVLNQGLG